MRVAAQLGWYCKHVIVDGELARDMRLHWVRTCEEGKWPVSRVRNGNDVYPSLASE